jgi:hypothetical protein
LIYELRTDTVYPGKLTKFLELFEREGRDLQARHCGHLVGFFTTETGTLNQAVQLWAYESATDRDAREVALSRDPEWRALRERFLPLIQYQEMRLLKPTAFSPLK